MARAFHVGGRGPPFLLVKNGIVRKYLYKFCVLVPFWFSIYFGTNKFALEERRRARRDVNPLHRKCLTWTTSMAVRSRASFMSCSWDIILRLTTTVLWILHWVLCMMRWCVWSQFALGSHRFSHIIWCQFLDLSLRTLSLTNLYGTEAQCCQWLQFGLGLRSFSQEKNEFSRRQCHQLQWRCPPQAFRCLTIMFYERPLIHRNNAGLSKETEYGAAGQYLNQDSIA